MDVQSVTLGAGERTRITQPGRFFMLIETGEALDVTFERNRSPLGEVGRNVEEGYVRHPGDWSDPNDGKFDSVVFQSTNAQTVRIGISSSAGDYKSFVTQVKVQQPNSGRTDPDETVSVTSSVVVAANASRRIVHLQNTGSGDARVAPGTVASNQGVLLKPGQSASFTTTAAINGIRAGATDTTISVTEETRT